MDWPELIKALGGGPLAVGVVAMAVVIWRLMKRNDEMVDKIIEMGARQTEALNGLARQIENAQRVLR